jgi:hypothetical protein
MPSTVSYENFSTNAQQYFSYIVAVGFIGEEKKPEYPVKITDLRKSLKNLIT